MADANSTMNQSNQTIKTSDWCSFSILDVPHVRFIFIAAYIIVFLCCSVGNLLLLIVIIVHPAMRTVTNFFLANLAAADLFVALFCIIQNLMHIFLFESGIWPLGALMCNMYVFIMHLIPCTSAGLLLVLSCERFIAIMRPIAARTLLTKNRLIIIACLVWSISIGTNVPYYLSAHHGSIPEYGNVSISVRGNGSITEWANDSISEFRRMPVRHYTWCSRSNRIIDHRIMFTFSFAFWYLIPLSVMIVIYSIIAVVLWRSTSTGAVARTSGLPGRSMKMRNSTSTIITTNGGVSPSLTNMSPRGSAAEFLTPTHTHRVQPLSPRMHQSLEELVMTESAVRKKSDPVHSEMRSLASNSSNSLSCRKSLLIDNGRQQHRHNNIDSNEAVESRKRVIRLLAAIVMAFACLTLPNHLRLLTNTWGPFRRRCLNGFEALTQPLSYLFLFLNSGINPILYAFMSKKFRSAVRELFSRKALREQRRERVRTEKRSTATAVSEFNTNTE